MGAGGSSKAKKAAALTLEAADSTAGVPGVKNWLGRGSLERDPNDKFLYWADLEECGFEKADTPLRETQAAVRVVVDANNSLVHAVWNVQDELCDILNIPVFSIEDSADAGLGNTGDMNATGGLNRSGTVKDAAAKSLVQPCLKRKGRQLEPYEIQDMIDPKINLSENFFFTYWDQFTEVCKMMAKNKMKAQGQAEINTEWGHTVMITKGEGMAMCSDMLRVNTVSYALNRQLIKESIADERATTIGCMMKPMLNILAKLRDKGKFTSFHLVMAIFPDNDVVDGCVEWDVKPDPCSMSELSEYKEVYKAVFGEDGLFSKLNKCLSLLKAASGPLSANPKKVLFLRDAKWKELCKEAQVDEKQIPIIGKKIIENLAKIRHCNVMAPACTEFVKTTFYDLHNAFKEATLLPPDEVIEGLPVPKSGFVEASIQLKWSAAAQAAAQERGDGYRAAGVELPAACNAGDRPDPNAKKKKEHKDKGKKEGAAGDASPGADKTTAATGEACEEAPPSPESPPKAHAEPPPESPPKATEEVTGAIAAGVVAAADEEEESDDEEGA